MRPIGTPKNARVPLERAERRRGSARHLARPLHDDAVGVPSVCGDLGEHDRGLRLRAAARGSGDTA